MELKDKMQLLQAGAAEIGCSLAQQLF